MRVEINLFVLLLLPIVEFSPVAGSVRPARPKSPWGLKEALYGESFKLFKGKWCTGKCFKNNLKTEFARALSKSINDQRASSENTALTHSAM
ncbi:Hypothetical predicted protein [Drosophila guanche]|uniref:Uncharacterized protein n=1 Tax=Drosophila guanche TaxID=7266 RepID=A0A3B0KCU8_DROGU|nr:Hypothetical predicted protein [Drosophila guanche]